MRKRKTISSKMQIIITMMIFVVPLLLFLTIYNIYTMNILNNKLAETGENTIHVYQNPIEKELNNTEAIMVDIIANDIDFQQLTYSTKEVDVYIYVKNIINTLKRTFSTSTAVGGCFVYHKGEDLIQEAYNGIYTYSQKAAFKEFFRTTINSKENISQGGWILESIEGEYFLFRIFNQKDSYIMSIFDLNKTDKPQENLDNKNAFLFFTDLDMNPLTSINTINEKGLELKDTKIRNYHITGKQQKYLIVKNKSEVLNLNLLYAVPYYGFLMDFDKMPFFFLAVSILVVCLIIFSFKILDKEYLNPLQELMKTMEVIKSGDIETKMTYESPIIEFDLLINTFNEMMEEIKLLKISTYEYQIDTQQAKLQYLQIQIRPHFFLNCLKNLYSLAQEEKYNQIQETILALSVHLRYILRHNLSLVDLGVEIQSVKNYILLQKLTTSYPVSCNIEVDSRLNKYEIPPLSILTFVENSVKHAQIINKHLKIQVKIGILDGDEERFVNISILDNGAGFSKESLNYLNESTNFEYQDQHIGIQNIKHRFSLMYDNKCTFSFSNITGGASIEIFIPIVKE